MPTMLPSYLRNPWRAARIWMDPFRADYRQRMARCLAPLFDAPITSVLDVGCDDGELATEITALVPRLEFQGVDIQSHRPSAIPRKLFDGRTIPFDDGSFDAVMAIDVLHHTRQIGPLLAEMARVSRKYVIIKDHLTDGPASMIVVGVADYLSNAPYGIPCEFNFPTLDGWQRYFAASRLKIVEFRRNLDLGAATIARYNPLFKLEKLAACQRAGRKPR
ncbi:MAG TPA: class I SAM-dependent methyltransferase [Pirellulales bacterium]|nr:class I SAM-dependent methyltransferase [Pirellulales bacterium]